MMPKAEHLPQPEAEERTNKFGVVEDGRQKISATLFNGERVEYTPDDFVMPVQGRDSSAKQRTLSAGDDFPIWITKDGKPETMYVKYMGVTAEEKERVPVVQVASGELYKLKKTDSPSAIDRGLYFLGQE
jgi:hypothetical protein